MGLAATLRAAEREARVFATLWRANVFGVFLAPILTLAALGIGLGGLVDDDARALDGLEYLEFITPGLLVASAVQTAAGGSLWPVMAGHRWLGFHYAQVASPMAAGDVYGGQVLWVGTRAGLQSAAFLLAGAAFGGVASAWGIVAVPVAIATAVAFGAPLAAFAATQDSDTSFDVILRVVIIPLYLFSGTMFPVEQLPSVLRVVVQLFPLAHGVEVARAATTGRATLFPVMGHLAVVALYIGAGWVWGRRAFRDRLTP